MIRRDNSVEFVHVGHVYFSSFQQLWGVEAPVCIALSPVRGGMSDYMYE